MLNSKKHFVIIFNSYDAFINEKRLMLLMTKRAKKVELKKPENGILCEFDDSKWIWFSKGIYKVRRIKESLPISQFIAISKIEKEMKNHFGKNGVLILNQETFSFFSKEFMEQGKRIAILHKVYEINSQYKETIEKKKRLLREIEELRSL